MTQQLDRRAAGKIFGRKDNWREKSRLAEKLGIKLCSLSNFLHGRGGLSADKTEAIFQRARELQQKHRAHQLVKQAIAKGQIVKPERCERCGSLPRTAMHGHHGDYAKPLEVVWVCVSCHWALHRSTDRMPEIEQKASAFHPRD